jgi:hypothetical protein
MSTQSKKAWREANPERARAQTLEANRRLRQRQAWRRQVVRSMDIEWSGGGRTKQEVSS